jgi:hypothetical protein
MRKITRVLTLLLLAALSIPGFAQDAEVVGGDEATLREFISRYLGVMGAPGAPQASVRIGQLPEDLPFEVRVPDATQVLGTVFNSDAFYTSYQVIATSNLSPDDVKAFYDSAYAGEMWAAATQGYQPGGFIERPSAYQAYCFNQSEAILNMNAVAMEDGATDLRLYINMPGDAYACGGTPPEQPPHPDPYAKLPTLQTPQGVTLVPGSVGGGGRPGFMSAASTALLDTARSLDDFGPEYFAQLEAQGWTAVQTGVAEGSAWSTWTFTDEDGLSWIGMFNLTAYPP